MKNADTRDAEAQSSSWLYGYQMNDLVFVTPSHHT